MTFAMDVHGMDRTTERLTKSLLGAAMAGALLLPPFADARDWRAGRGPIVQAPEQPVKKGPGPQKHGERDKRGEHDKSHQSKLTKEERRELNRDLDRANREIYRRK